MIANSRSIRWHVTGFERYRPENRINRGLVAAAPWVNVSLLIFLYLFLTSPFVLQPGIVVRLPDSPFAAGSRYGHNMVVLAPEGPGRGSEMEIVFFDDQRYLVRQPAQLDDLRSALARAVRERPGQPLVIEADRAVGLGTIVQLFNMAADTGVREVNIATRPAPPR